MHHQHQLMKEAEEAVAPSLEAVDDTAVGYWSAHPFSKVFDLLLIVS